MVAIYKPVPVCLCSEQPQSLIPALPVSPREHGQSLAALEYFFGACLSRINGRGRGGRVSGRGEESSRASRKLLDPGGHRFYSEAGRSSSGASSHCLRSALRATPAQRAILYSRCVRLSGFQYIERFKSYLELA